MENYTEWSAEVKEKAGKEFTGLLKQMTSVIIALGLNDKVRIDTKVLSKAVIDYFEDIIRLEQFQGIIANTAKVYAYSTYWLLQRNPIMIVSDTDDPATLYINERVCTAILISKMQREKDVKKASNEYFVNLLYYNFKYREYTAKTLELAIEAYFHGVDMGRVNTH